MATIEKNSSVEEWRQMLVVALRAETPPEPTIVNQWNFPTGETWYGVELPCNSDPADFHSTCVGTIKVHFHHNQRGSKIACCWNCHKEVSVSISAISIGLGLI